MSSVYADKLTTTQEQTLSSAPPAWFNLGRRQPIVFRDVSSPRRTHLPLCGHILRLAGQESPSSTRSVTPGA